MTVGSPWTFHAHPWCWVVVLAPAIGYVAVGSRPRWAPSRGQVVWFFGGLASVVAALTWPVADVAAHWSLLGLVVQRLLLLLAAPPMLVLGTPASLRAWLTRPAPVDSLLRTVARPSVAVLVVTVVVAGTLSGPAVDAQSRSIAVRAVIDAVLLATGFVLWEPVVGAAPGTHRPGALGRAGYLVIQSIVPSFLSLVWIFARHPLYSVFDHGRQFAGLTPLLDQQLAGFVAKFSTIAVLWTVAFVTLVGAERTADPTGHDEPLTWSDVERELQRVDRRARRRAWLPGAVPPTAPPREPPIEGPARPGDTPNRRGDDP